MHVLVIGDGAALTTGFAQVIRECCKEFNARNWRISQIASLDIGPQFDSEAYRTRGIEPYFPNPYDHVGRSVLSTALAAEPDVIFLNSDPGTAQNWLRELKKQNCDLPTMIYAPIEGAPILPVYAETFAMATKALTYTQWASDSLKAEHGLDIDYVYHGVDASVFYPYQIEGSKRQLRHALGWEGKFVVMYVARNAARKAQDRLLKAMAELKMHGINDVLLYLHCARSDNNQLQGWDLDGVAHWCGVSDSVQWSDQRDAVRGVEQISLAEKYRAADLYVHVAKVEGFGLPILEALASGLPVVIPKDGGNMEEVAGDAVAAKIAPVDWDTWFNGAQLANLAPEHIALTIKALKENPAIRESAARRGVERATQFSWNTMAQTIADGVASVATRNRVAIPA